MHQHQRTPWTPAHVRYAEKIAIRLAVEVVSGDPHPMTDGTRHHHRQGNLYFFAARFIGAVGGSRLEDLVDLTDLLRLHGVKPIPLVELALEAA